jgi:ethanolamine utilization protein EutN
MRTAQIKGYVTSTVKHPSYEGWRLLIAQPTALNNAPDGAPQIVIDPLGAAIGQSVIISSDGSEARKTVGDELSPARWMVVGIVDPEGTLAV